MNSDIAKEISTFVVDTFLFGRADRLKNDTSFLAEGLIDSTGVLELVTLVEEKYGIHVEDHELIPENFDSVQCIANYVGRKLGRPSGAVTASAAAQA